MENKLNGTSPLFEDNSIYFLEISRKINIFITLLVITIGLAGNSLIILVFHQRSFRKNPANVYLLCLAIIDSLFLVIHLFEDTLRTYQDIYRHSASLFYKFTVMINFFDNSDLACKCINYFRYFLRFLSAYIIVVFTLQRLFIVYFPFKKYFKSKHSAWLTFLILTISSLILNIWAFVLFRVDKNDNDYQYCDIHKQSKRVYFSFAVIYTTLTMLIPIMTIFTCNFLIMHKANQAQRDRLEMTNSIKQRRQVLHINSNCKKKFRIKPYYLTVSQRANRIKQDGSKNLSFILVLISFSYAILNLPYFITWLVFFCQIAFNHKFHWINKNYLFGVLQLTEIFYVLNYGFKFFVFCFSGSIFRNQLKYTSN